MNVYLGHLSNYIKTRGASTAVRSILDGARAAGDSTPQLMDEGTLAIRLPAETVDWLRQEARTQRCSMAQITRAHIARQIVSELTVLYQKNSTSVADFSAALWLALGYEPASSPGEEVRDRG